MWQDHYQYPLNSVKGVLHPEMSDILFFFNIKIFLQFKFQICAYTQLKLKNYKKNLKIPQGGCAAPPNFPKLGVSSVKDTAKTNKDLGMSCYIQVEYSAFFPLVALI